jgi:hypothetical protein
VFNVLVIFSVYLLVIVIDVLFSCVTDSSASWRLIIARRRGLLYASVAILTGSVMIAHALFFFEAFANERVIFAVYATSPIEGTPDVNIYRYAEPPKQDSQVSSEGLPLVNTPFERYFITITALATSSGSIYAFFTGAKAPCWSSENLARYAQFNDTLRVCARHSA